MAERIFHYHFFVTEFFQTADLTKVDYISICFCFLFWFVSTKNPASQHKLGETEKLALVIYIYVIMQCLALWTLMIYICVRM